MKTAYRWMAASLAMVLMSGMAAWGQEGGKGMRPARPMLPGLGRDDGMRGKWAERITGGEMNEAGMIEQLLNKTELTSQIGLTDEQMAALQKAVDELRKQQKELRAEKEKAGLDQAKLMLETNVNEQAVMAAVERAGKADTDIAKLRVKQLLVLRNTLTAEQKEKMKEIIRLRVSKMQEEARKTNRGMSGRQGGVTNAPGVVSRPWMRPAPPPPPPASAPPGNN